MKKLLLTVLIFLVSILCASCSEQPSEDIEPSIHFIPECVNCMAYGGPVDLQIAFVSNYEIISINDLDLKFEFDEDSSMDSYKYKRLYLLEEYNEYYIYRINIDLINIKGGVKVTDVSFKDSNDNYYEEKCDIFYSSYYEEKYHFNSGNGSWDIQIFGYKSMGINEILQANDNLTLTDFYFKNRTSFDLTDYIDEVKINKLPFDKNLDIVKDEVFSLNVSFIDETPDEMVLINELMFNCIDSDNNKVSASICAYIILGDFIMAGEVYIDQI